MTTDPPMLRAGGRGPADDRLARRLLGLTVAPGAGKSTLTARIVDALAPAAVLVPMDGFHLANTELRHLSRTEREGAPARSTWTAIRRC
jgi:pantothenate kinase